MKASELCWLIVFICIVLGLVIKDSTPFWLGVAFGCYGFFFEYIEYKRKK